MDQNNQRIKRIANAASILFLEQGYARTQISHIAMAAGISVGSIYLDFAGKKEIMHFSIKCSLEPGFADRQFKRPITDDLFTGLQEEVLDVFISGAEEFERHLGNTGSYGFETLLSDLFDQMARYAQVGLFVKRNREEFPILSQNYDAQRRRTLSALTSYITRYISLGTVRRVEDPALTALFVLQTLAWWSTDMHVISYHRDEISLETAKKVCMDNLLFAYMRHR